MILPFGRTNGPFLAGFREWASGGLYSVPLDALV